MKYTIAAIALAGFGIAFAPAAGAAPCVKDANGQFNCSGGSFSAFYGPDDSEDHNFEYGATVGSSGFVVNPAESSFTVAGHTFSTADNPLDTGT